MYTKLPYFMSNFNKATVSDDYRLMGISRPSFINKAKCNEADHADFGKYIGNSDSITTAMYAFGVVCLILAVLVVILGLLVLLLRNKANNGFFTKSASVWTVNGLAIICAILIIIFAIIAMLRYSS
jgi:hypothetical protein